MPQFSYKVDKEAAGFIKKSNLANQDRRRPDITRKARKQLEQAESSGK